MIICFLMTVIMALEFLLPANVAAMPTSFSPVGQPVVALSGRLLSLSGTQPDDLGLSAGHLGDCPASPNCVSSEATDTEHFIEPLAYRGQPEAVFKALRSVVAELPRTEVMEATDRYLYVQFTSQWLGFVDDVEFALDPAAQHIDVRSASRLGESDLGVNRKRVETIRAALAAKTSEQISEIETTATPEPSASAPVATDDQTATSAASTSSATTVDQPDSATASVKAAASPTTESMSTATALEAVTDASAPAAAPVSGVAE
jgi:uncharacterized protein (DUF1499 family)